MEVERTVSGDAMSTNESGKIIYYLDIYIKGEIVKKFTLTNEEE